MRQLGDLLVGLFFLAVFAAAGFGIWAAITPEWATAARDGAARDGAVGAAGRLTSAPGLWDRDD